MAVIVSLSATASAGTTAVAVARPTLDQMRTRRRDQRSTNAPANRPSRAAGSSSARHTRPIESVPWPSSRAAVHGSASRETSEPNVDTPSPMIKMRRSRCFHAARSSALIGRSLVAGHGVAISLQLLLHRCRETNVDTYVTDELADFFGARGN